jgi:hypothetical protein
VVIALGWSGVGAASAAPRTWRKVPSPSVAPHNHGNFLFDVDCVRTDWCVAVGQAQRVTAPQTTAIIEHWDGGDWSMMTPSIIAGQTGLRGVTCLADDDCTAVGWGPAGTLVERWDGDSWSVESSPNQDASDTLDDVACSSSARCFAVGSGDPPHSGEATALLEQWDGARWTVVPSLTPVETSELNGVACASPTRCFAVGNQRRGQLRMVTLVETWDGASWSIVKSPNPPATRPQAIDTLSAIACSSTTVCTAVGSDEESWTVGSPLAERWNGRGWRLVPTPGVANSGAFGGIDCVGNYCAVVGYSGSGSNGSSTLVETTRGHDFTVVPSASPGAGYNFLAGVACSGIGACAAVGEWGGAVAPPWERTLVLSP